MKALARTIEPSWSKEKGVGYCRIRSEAHGRRVGHPYRDSATCLSITTLRCSWCWGSNV